MKNVYSAVEWAVPILIWYVVSLTVNAVLSAFLREPLLDCTSIAVTGVVLIPVFVRMMGKMPAGTLYGRGPETGPDSRKKVSGRGQKHDPYSYGEAAGGGSKYSGRGQKHDPYSYEEAARNKAHLSADERQIGFAYSRSSDGTVSGCSRILTVVSLPAGMLLSWGSGRLMEWAGVYAHFSNQTQENMLSAPLFLQIIALVIISPVMEELLYRGLVFTRLSRYISWVAAMLIASGCFALGHGNVIQILYAFPLGLILTMDAHYSGTMIAPILMHVGANLLTVMLS